MQASKRFGKLQSEMREEEKVKRNNFQPSIHEETTEVSKLQTDIEELKREKEHLDSKIAARYLTLNALSLVMNASRQKKIENRNKEAVQLINIANKFYKERSQYQLLASERITEAGLEAEEHRAKMQDLANRMDYYNQLISVGSCLLGCPTAKVALD
eukprot:756307-Hanusia_phi.AAC.2